MSQYNKTVLTRAGLELAKRANAGQAKFGITRAVTSADDWSHKTVQDLEEVTTIPNIMQQGTIMDTNEVESNNSVIGVSLCFTNKNLSTGYQIRVIGLYVKEEGQENDFLYAVTTAITPEYMPSFADKVLYRFNTQMYLVIGNAQSVNVVINDGTAVTHGQLDKYKVEVTENLKKLENTHKEDMSHVAKSASINGGAEILPDSTGKLNLVVPDPDLSKYVSLEQLGELLKAKADKADTYTKSNIDDIHSKSYFRKQGMDQNGNTVEIRTNAVKQSNGGYAIDIYDTDWTASKLADVLAQLPNKADTSTVNAQIADAKNTAQSNLDKAKSDLNDAINAKANSSDLTALDKKAVKSVGIYPNNLHFESGSFNYWSDEVKASPDANGYAVIDLADDEPVRAAADQLNVMLTGLNHLQGKQTKDSADANALSETGVYYCSSPAKNFPVSQWGTLVTSNGNGERASQLYFPDDNTAVWFRTLDGDWRGWVRLANIDDVNNAKSILTSSINAKANQSALDATNANVTQLQNSKLNFKYISDGYDLLSADGFWGVMEANNAQNLKNLPNGMNNKTWMYVLKLVKDIFGTVIIFDQDNCIWVNNKNGDVWNGWASYAHQSDVTALQNIINQQNQTIQSLTSRLNNAENEINYIKANYVEGRRFPASQEAQAEAWENEKPTRLAMIEK
ncbi:pyocin knob domain-containing protein [Lactobacillus amylovorus]|uniref:pyocin knob domain-containing protein n=1 Tax=Lactobacillus amylovorus TaxID=1604 RepID=UPI003F8C5BD3